METSRSFKNVLVTGGAAFIGSNFIRYLLGSAGFQGRVVNVDALTYAGHPDNVSSVRADSGECYNIGGENEWENITLLGRLIEIVARGTGRRVDDLRSLISCVKDRPGHDRRYSIDCGKLKRDLRLETIRHL